MTSTTATTNNNSECCAYCQKSPYLMGRSRWVQAAIIKSENDQYLESIDRRTWYRLTRIDLLHDEYRKVFQEFHDDEETKAFLEQSQAKSNNLPVQILHSLASSFLTLFIARTSGIYILINIKYKEEKSGS